MVTDGRVKMTPLEELGEMGREGDFGSLTFHDYFRLFSGTKTIQTFDDKGENPLLAKIFHFDGAMSKLMANVLQDINSKGAGIYLCISETDGKGRCAVNVKRIRAVFADLDGAPVAPALEYHPTVVVESSPRRYHCYWLTDDVPMAGFPVLQKNIARHLGGDPKVHDTPRVMRVPGFYHQKGKPFLSKIHSGTGIKFTYRELTEWFPPLPVKQWSGKRYKLNQNMSNMGEFHGQYGAGNGERNEHVLKIIGGMIKRGCKWDYITEEAFKDGRSCNPPLEDREIQSILNSAQRYV